jgi:transglutaminase-like putative cysteine protease
MKKIHFFLIAVLYCSLSIAKEDPKFPVSSIPAELKKDVNVVFRKDEMIFTIYSKSKASYRVYQVITILNANGNHYAEEVIGYDKLSKVVSLQGNVYDAEGRLLRRLKSSEVIDQSAYDGFSLYSDNRLKKIDLSYGTYPYTVEFEYEVELKYLFSIPTFHVLPVEKVSVESGVYKLIYPANSAPRYKAVNIDAPPVKEKLSDNKESVSWTFRNVMPIKIDPSGPSPVEYLQHIVAAPTHFEYEGYSGTMDTWDNFGQWINTLNEGRGLLPEDARRKVKALILNAKTEEEKVKILYEDLQSKTRYVSIQLGIGGLQPFEASVVNQTGYGDCKALSNYMVSVLREAGVKAHYTLIYAGENAPGMDVSFPRSQFNHAIVAVPNKGDTLWLECTSQTNPFGYMGRFTGDRKALIITDDGAKVVHTKRYTAKDNLQYRTADVDITLTGDAKATVKTTYKGLQYENGNLDYIVGNQYDDQKKWLQKNMGIPTYDINSFQMVNKKDKIPSAIVNVDLTLNRLATVSGKRIFLTPNLMNRSTYIPEKVESRKTKVVRKMAYTDIDTIKYHLPEGIYPEFLPPGVSYKSQFGEYQTSFTLDQNNLLYIRKMIMHKGEFPPDSYAELIEFFKNVSKADNTKMVFLSKT